MSLRYLVLEAARMELCYLNQGDWEAGRSSLSGRLSSRSLLDTHSTMLRRMEDPGDWSSRRRLPQELAGHPSSGSTPALLGSAKSLFLFPFNFYLELCKLFTQF